MARTKGRFTRTDTRRSGWRTLRVIVEIPSRGAYSEKDLAGHIIGALQINNVPYFRKDVDQDFGTLRVLQHNRKAPYL